MYDHQINPNTGTPNGSLSSYLLFNQYIDDTIGKLEISNLDFIFCLFVEYILIFAKDRIRLKSI